jgi:hypothetical protein
MDPLFSAHSDIDVEAIMAAIERKIQEKKDAGLIYEPHLYTDYVPTTPETEIPPAVAGETAAVTPVPQRQKTGGLIKKALKKFFRFFRPLFRFLGRKLLPDLVLSKEYIRLLHHTCNNLIVELTKLKIEVELLKTKVKALEDRQEFLENRERVLEKKISS